MANNRKFDSMKLGLLRDAKRFVWLLVLFFVVFQFLIGFSYVSGYSMFPTLEPHELVLYFRPIDNLKPGDVLSVRVPSGDYFVKRVIAVEGDTVDIRDGAVFVNGIRLDEPYVASETEPHESVITYPLTVGVGQYFVLGDNREVSEDSRNFGCVSPSQIKGRLLFAFSFQNGLRFF